MNERGATPLSKHEPKHREKLRLAGGFVAEGF